MAVAASGVATGLMCLVIAFVSLQAVYPSALEVARFIGYVLAFNVLPGLVVTRLMFPGLRGPSTHFVFSLALGVVTNTLVVILLWIIGRLPLLNLLPFVAGSVLLAGYRHLRLKVVMAEWRVGRSDLQAIAGTVFFCVTASLNMAYFHSLPPTDSFFDRSWFHFGVQGWIVRALEFGRPPPHLLIPDVPLSYNYAAHLWMLGANHIGGLPLDVLVARFGPVFLGGSAAAMMLAFGRRLLGLSWWVAPLPVVCVFWIVAIPDVIGWVFGNFMPLVANLILSPFLAFLIFFITIAFVVENRPASPAGRLTRGAVLLVLSFLATGARGTCPPILICALLLRLLVVWRQQRAFPRDHVADLIALALGFVAGLWFFFTLGSGFSGTDFITFIGQPFTLLASRTVFTLPQLLMRHGMTAIPAGMIAFAVIALFQAGFLLPTLPRQLAAMRRQASESEVLLLGSAIAGIAAVFMTVAPGFSHFSFLHFSSIGLSLLGSRGLQLMVSRREARKPWIRGADLLAMLAVVLLACLQLSQLPRKTMAQLGDDLSASALALPNLSQQPAPRLASCARDQDGDLLASAGRMASDPVVILLVSDYCAPVWWVMRAPVQTMDDFFLAVVTGSTNPLLQQILSTRVEHMHAAVALAGQGILSVADLVAIAGTVEERRPVFLMADRTLSPKGDPHLLAVAGNDRLILWRLEAPGRSAVPSATN
jgi:hypothetical protein